MITLLWTLAQDTSPLTFVGEGWGEGWGEGGWGEKGVTRQPQTGKLNLSFSLSSGTQEEPMHVAKRDIQLTVTSAGYMKVHSAQV